MTPDQNTWESKDYRVTVERGDKDVSEKKILRET
jgi:hypothetical protein